MLALLVGSTEAYSGKSATILGIASQLQSKGIKIGLSKPLGNYPDPDFLDQQEEDVTFMARALGLPEQQTRSPLLCLQEGAIEQVLQSGQMNDYSLSLANYLAGITGDLILIEGPGNLSEGCLFNLSLGQMAQTLAAPILLVTRYHASSLVDRLVSAQGRLGDSLLGAIITDIPEERLPVVNDYLRPFFERRKLPIFGAIPRNSLLRSVSVAEIVHQLRAKVLCCVDRLDLMVESLTIGAMNVNSALEYFRKGKNMAVVTGGDRSELQMAALETSTNCLILTGHVPPQGFILSRAEDLEIPILAVDLDTLTTVEIIDRAFGQVRLHEPIKVECIRHLMAVHFDSDRLIKALGLKVLAA